MLQLPRCYDAVILAEQMVRNLFCVLHLHDALRDDESHARRGQRDVHVGRTRQIQKIISPQTKSMPARFSAARVQAESRTNAI